jgi:hypothetical protein
MFENVNDFFAAIKADRFLQFLLIAPVQHPLDDDDSPFLPVEGLIVVFPEESCREIGLIRISDLIFCRNIFYIVLLRYGLKLQWF